jgi:deazaflavin-dependent oxidoreductase (nitroreductase family)
MPVLLLTTVGRKTGKTRTTPLMYIRDGESYVIGASNNGRDKHPGWFYNQQAAPGVQIEVPGQRFAVKATIATPKERQRIWPELVAQVPVLEGYRNRTTRTIPVVILKPQ